MILRRSRMPVRHLSLRSILPNLVTLLAIALGMSAVRTAYHGAFEQAVVMILLAAFLDGIDGPLARAFQGVSRLGAELDSLADFVNFGVVPALVLYIWQLQYLPDFGWLACMAYAMATAIRLARFNVINMETQNAPVLHFTGVPSPMGGLLVLLPLMISFVYPDMLMDGIVTVWAVYIVMIASFLIIPVQTFALKALRLKHRWLLPFMTMLSLMLIMLLVIPWWLLIGVNITYLCYMFWRIIVTCWGAKSWGK